MIHGTHEEWTRKTTAVREAIDKFKASSRDSEAVKQFASDLEEVTLAHESVSLELATKYRKSSPDDLHARMEIGMRLEHLGQELGVTYDPWIAAPRPSLSEFMDSMATMRKGAKDEILKGGLRRGELLLVSAGQRDRVMKEVELELDKAREQGSEALKEALTPRPVSLSIRGTDNPHSFRALRPIGKDVQIIDHDGTPGKNNKVSSMVGDTIYGINLVEDFPYDPVQATCDDLTVDQDPNYQRRNGPDKPKSHVVSRGRPSSVVMNLMARFNKK